MNSFQMVKDTLNDIVREEAAAYEEQIKGYRRTINVHATPWQKESYEKAIAFGWYLTLVIFNGDSCDDITIELERSDNKKTLIIHRDGSSSRKTRLFD